MFFSKKKEEKSSGTVERIGVVQESSGDCGRTCYALLFEGDCSPIILDTPQSLIGQGYKAIFDLRVQIALTAPGDQIEFTKVSGYVTAFENKALKGRS